MKYDNQSVVQQLQEQTGKVRDEFNTRMEGLTKSKILGVTFSFFYCTSKT